MRHTFFCRARWATPDYSLSSDTFFMYLQKDAPDHHDAELVLRFYELRREPVMRQSRSDINGKFFPANYEEFLAVTKTDHPLNAAYRQTSSYWEMVYGMAKHGVIHADFMLESCAEGLYLFAKVRPYLERFRNEVNSNAFQNAEWVALHSARGKAQAEHYAKRVASALADAKRGASALAAR
ncbi:MAG: DUF4760 domain-containing protein [Gemmatimonadaceae bacterium]